jgi:hypothetical protein
LYASEIVFLSHAHPADIESSNVIASHLATTVQREEMVRLVRMLHLRPEKEVANTTPNLTERLTICKIE